MLIELRYLKEDGTPCSAIENIKAIAKHPNGWCDAHYVDLCKNFNGTEEEAWQLLLSVEHNANANYGYWKNYQ